MNRLILCAGETRRDGWKTLDANPRNEPDYLAVLPPLPLAVRSIAWDEIELVHGITSFYQWQGEQLLSELHGVLKPGGKLVLEQPNFKHAIRNVNWLFGDPTFRNPLHMNHYAYSPESLIEALQKAGFRRIDIKDAQHHDPVRDFRAEAYV